MIEKGIIEAHLEGILQGTGMFMVEVRISNDNRIQVYVDKKEGISIDDCVDVNRALENMLDRDQEDYALEVSSPGLDNPFKVFQQYVKNIGKKVIVKLKDGNTIPGVLLKADKDGILIEQPSGKKDQDPEKKKVAMNEIHSTRLHIQL